MKTAIQAHLLQTESQMLGSAAFVDAPWEYVRVEGASHWLQLDRPELINQSNSFEVFLLIIAIAYDGSWGALRFLENTFCLRFFVQKGFIAFD